MGLMAAGWARWVSLGSPLPCRAAGSNPAVAVDFLCVS